MFFSASLSLLTDARPQRKKTWWYAFTAAKAGSDSNAGRDGEATGASSAFFCSSFFTSLWVATSTRDKTGGNWCVFCYFLVLLFHFTLLLF